MAQSRFSRRLGFLVILAALSFSMVLPAFALFDQDDTARGRPVPAHRGELFLDHLP